MKSSIYKKFLSLLLGSVAAASLLIGAAGIFSAQNAVSKDSVQIMNLICEEKAQQINAILTAIEQSVQIDYGYVKNQVSKDDFAWHDTEYMHEYAEKIRPVLKNTAENTDFAVGVYLRFNPEICGSGTEGVFLVNKNGVFEDEKITDLTLYSPEDTGYVGWYYEPVKNGAPTWMNPYYNENTGVKMISYIIPIYIDDTLIGVIGMDIDISLLINTVKEISLYDTGYAFLACGNGDIVYHRQYPEGIEKKNFDENLLDIRKQMQGVESNDSIVSYSWYGAEKRLSYTNLLNGMYLIITAPSSEIDAERNSLILRCVIIMAVVLGISAFLGIRLVRKITKPLRELTDAAERIAEGEWDVEIHRGGDDEVGVLADTLHHTIDELQKYINYVSGIAYIDEMTGLGNNRFFSKRIAETESAIADKSARFSMAAVDIINLRHISDTYGTGKGNSIIVTVAELMKKIFGNNSVYRISDEMFSIYLENTDKNGANELVRSFESELEEFNRHGVICPEEIMVAAGTACFDPEKDTCFAEVTTRAGKELFNSKKQLADRRGMLEDALKMLQMVFHKILKVNLTDNNFHEIKVYDEERSPEKGYCAKFSEWMNSFAGTGQVAAEDISEYLKFSDRKQLCRRFASGETYLSHCYRRKVSGEFRWVMLEIITSVEYTPENQIVLLYVRDINDFYTAKLEYHRELERLSNTDTLTGLYNRHYMTQFFRDCSSFTDIGVIFCDLNGLKYANDHFGHTAGDRLLNSIAEIMKKDFPDNICCRTGGDEFIVCVVGKSEQEFGDMFEKFRADVRASGKPIASLGKCWRSSTEDIDRMLTEAENAMYEDKKAYYRDFPEYKR